MSLHGDLDARLRPYLHASLTALSAARPQTWTVDLADVSFCDVPGVRFFLAMQHRAQRRSTDLVLLDARPSLSLVFSWVGLADHLSASTTPRHRLDPPPSPQGGR
ncbi:STAS domain-containing protein [Geodermatophilus sp. FMUSA9-8]|uniref:STAS domain-containing protein n=1 Tax=Geodermatophilus sp. FMUSA9-8 TaxID=3120155 RepID=UPI003FA5FC22